MGNLLILNGSPRAPRSNSRRYAQIFSSCYGENTEYFDITKRNHPELCAKLAGASHVLFVFPLYADGLPVTLLNFLKSLEAAPPQNKPAVSVLINCGFLEPRQNEVAIDMLKLFCRKNGFPFGSSLSIGSGEAILQTPFALFVKGAIQKLARAISSGKTVTLSTRMPLSQKRYVQEAERYWLKAGGKNGLSAQQMRSTTIESKGASSQKA